MSGLAPEGRPPGPPPATVTSDPLLGCWWVRCRPAGPAGAHVLRLPFGVLARVDRAIPTAVLDVSVLLDGDGAVPETALELLELLVGPSPTALVLHGEEGTAHADPVPSPARDALLALVALDVDQNDEGPSLVAAEAAFLAAQASASLREWAAPFIARGQHAFRLLDLDLSAPDDRDRAARVALSRLAAVVGVSPPRREHEDLVDLDADAFEAMWAGAERLSLAGAARMRSVRPLQRATVKLAGMPVNAALFKGLVTVEYDQTEGEVIATAQLAVPVAPLWLRVVEADGSRSCQVPFVDTGGGHVRATAVAQGILDADFEIEVTDDRRSPSMTRAERARRAAQTNGGVARRLVNALLSAPPPASRERWSAAARAWLACADEWTMAGDKPRASLAKALAAVCFGQAGDHHSATRERSRADRLGGNGDPGSSWATPYRVESDLLKLPRPRLAELAAPLVARWARDVLARLDLRPSGPAQEADVDYAVARLLEIAQMTGDDPSIRGPRGKAALAIASVALGLHRPDIATELIHRGLADVAAAQLDSDDPAWDLGRKLLEDLHERDD